jgi:putative oxidoreductase
MKTIFRIGRIAYGGFFLFSSLNHFLKTREMAGYAGSKGVPLPDAAVLGSGALLAFGGTSLIAGQRPDLGGAAIALFLSSVSPMMHNFWAVPPEQKQNEMIHFSKNMALLGAALCIAAAREPRD